MQYDGATAGGSLAVELDALAQMASQLFSAPTAHVTVFDADGPRIVAPQATAAPPPLTGDSDSDFGAEDIVVSLAAADDPAAAGAPRASVHAAIRGRDGRLHGTLTLGLDDASAFASDDRRSTLRALARQAAALIDCDRMCRELAASERERIHFAAVFANAMDGVLHSRPDGAVLAANAAACAMLGRDEDELRRIGRDALLDRTDPRLPGLLAERARHGRAQGQLRMVRASGESFEVEISSAIYEDRDGRPAAVTLFRDVTERHVWAERTRASLALLHNLARGVPGVLYQYRLFPDGRSCFPFASPGMQQLFELAPEDVRDDASEVFRRVHTDDLAQVSQAIFRSAQTLEPWVQEYRVVLPRQGLRWRLGNASPERLPDGSVLWHGFVSDITERKRDEARLARIHRALRVVGACGTLLSESSDEQQFVEAVCRAAIEAGGYLMGWIGFAEDDPARSVRVAAVAGRHGGYPQSIRVSWDEHSPTGQGPIGVAIRSGRPQAVQNWWTDESVAQWRAAALQRGYQSSVAVPLTAGGRALGVLVLYDAEPQAFGADEVTPLEELGRSVGLAIHWLRASRQRDAAESASRAKSAFLANMSHEIRTPLNAIIGLADLLRGEGVTPAQARRLESIERSSRHLLSLVDDVLDLSKIEAQRLQLVVHEFRPAELVEDVAAIVAPAAAAKGVRLEVDHAALPPAARGDAARLRQVLLNFAGNAVKFTAHGSVRIAGRTIGEDDDGRLVLRFEVVDSGIGIEPAHRARLFQPFEQGDDSVTRRYGGTGLGLAIARRLVALMDGECGVESEPGVGSVFWFTARVGRGSGRTAAPSPAAAADAADALRRGFRGARVLLAEDNAVNREVATAMLARVGLEVVEVPDGRAVVEAARSGDFDLVLMDMQMPEMSGIEAARAIRRLPGWATRPIVAMTANTLDSDRTACADAGMDDFITKPMSASGLYRTILHWLASARAGAPSASGR